MSVTINITDVCFSDDMLSVHLENGEVIATPLEWYPRLVKANAKQRDNWKVLGKGIGLHWPDVDEDLSIEGMRKGNPSYEYLKQKKLRESATANTAPLEMR